MKLLLVSLLLSFLLVHTEGQTDDCDEYKNAYNELREEFDKVREKANLLEQLKDQSNTQLRQANSKVASLEAEVRSLKSSCASGTGKPNFTCPASIGKNTYCFNNRPFGCHCFVVIEKTLKEQEAFCQSNGMKLISVESKEENDSLNPLYKKTTELHKDISFHGFWTSSSDEAEEGRWIWTATGQPHTYSNWGNAEPNGGRGENGMEIFFKQPKYFFGCDGESPCWIDLPTSFLKYAICEA